ncbi:hypothetical protein FOL47_004690, partial [Perkinsus chesapeaki]
MSASDLMFDPITYEAYTDALRAYLTDQVDLAITQASGNAQRNYDRSNTPQGFFVGARCLLRLMKHERPTKLSPMWEANWFITSIVGSHDPIKVVRLFHLPTKRVKVLSVDHLKLDPLQPDNIEEIKLLFPEPLPEGPLPPLSDHGSAALSSDTVPDDQPHVRFEGLIGAGSAVFRPREPQQARVNPEGLIGGGPTLVRPPGIERPHWPGLDSFRPQVVVAAGPPQVAPAYFASPAPVRPRAQQGGSGPTIEL